MILWRWSEAEASRGILEMDSVGGQMRSIARGDRLFVCATKQDELFLLGVLQAKKVVKERNSAARDAFGFYRALCRNLSGPFGITPLGDAKWSLRFVNTASDRLDPNKKIAMQVRQHRFLSERSASMLLSLLNPAAAAVEQERRFEEGERRAYLAMRPRRHAALRAEARRHWGLTCYCCEFDYAECYGDLGEGLAIVHHLDPLGSGHRGSRETSVQDVRVVCANCHHVLHRTDPPVHVDDLKKRISQRRARRS
jgi:hypothetical protein